MKLEAVAVAAIPAASTIDGHPKGVLVRFLLTLTVRVGIIFGWLSSFSEDADATNDPPPRYLMLKHQIPQIQLYKQQTPHLS